MPADTLPSATPAPPTTQHFPRPVIKGEQCSGFGAFTVCASSVLAPWRDVTYGPANMFDDRLDTAWVEGADGDGIGERFTVKFDTVTAINGVSLLNGYHKSNELFHKNGRVASGDCRSGFSPKEGLIDMGTSFDCFDPRSWLGAEGLTSRQVRNRGILQAAMAKAGFQPYRREWWHFSYPAGDAGAAFDFSVSETALPD